MTTRPTRNILYTLFLGVAVAAIGGCTRPEPGELVAQARADLDRREPQAAVVRLKDALQQNPDLAAARFLLGRALALQANHGAAEIELRRALDLGQPEVDIYPELASSMLSAGAPRRVIKEFAETRLREPKAQIQLQVVLAKAYAAVGERRLASKAIDAALAMAPDHAAAHVLRARLLAADGDVEGALAIAEQQTGRKPPIPEAWQLLGDLRFFAKADRAGALEAYRTALVAQPDFVAAHSGVLTLLLARGELPEAKEQLARLRAAAPFEPRTVYFTASVALLAGELEKAHEQIQRLLKVDPSNTQFLQLAGAIDLRRGALHSAETQLTRALQAAPDLVAARRLLAQVYLRRGEAGRAVRVIEPWLARDKNDADALSLIGQAYLLEGKLPEAERAFAQAAKANPDDSRAAAALAVGRLARGDEVDALAALRSIASTSSSTAADLPLISTLVMAKRYDDALVAIARLDKKMPTSALPLVLQGQVHLDQGNQAEAEAAFVGALARQPSFFPAAAAQSKMDLAAGRIEAAAARFDAVLKADPSNVDAWRAKASFASRTGATVDEVLTILAQAVEKTPARTEMRLERIQLLMKAGRQHESLEEARKAAAAFPYDPQVMDALGLAQALAGDANQAQATFAKLSQLAPESPLPHLRLAEMHRLAGRPGDELKSLENALAVAPTDLSIRQRISEVLVGLGRHDDAVLQARWLLDNHPSEELGYLAHAVIEGSRQRWSTVEQIYRAGLKKIPTGSQLAAGLHALLLKTGRAAEADRTITKWMEQHPQDARFLFMVGDQALATGDHAKAEARYRAVLAIQPENAAAMNNVAWLLATSGRAGAVAMAQAAAERQPGSAAILETLGQAHLAEGDRGRAAEAFKRALQLARTDLALRLRLAKGLLGVGEKKIAQEELRRLAGLGEAFAGHAETRQLLSGLD